MAGAFNSFMNVLFDAVTWPFQWFHPVVGLTVISAVAGVVLLLMFKYTSPQAAIKRVKSRLWTSIHEIRIYKDELGVLTRAIGRLFRDNLVYFLCCSVALVPMVVAVLPILFQLDSRYGFAPLKKDDVVVMNVVLADGFDPVKNEVTIEFPDGGLSIDAGPVRVAAERELVYRVRVEEPGTHEMAVVVDGERYTKRIDAEEDGNVRISPARYSEARLTDALMFPAEPPFDGDGPVEAVAVNHARAAMIGIDGDYYPWLIIFCVVGLVFGYLMKDVFKVNL